MALNHVTPFLSFAHLTATQALLEALTSDGDDILHIVDVNIAGHGAQWPYFLQALADKRCEQGCPVKSVRITATGTNLATLEYIGLHLREFARARSLPFEFVPLVQDLESLTPEILHIQDGEAVGVNCMNQLHKLLTRGPEMLTNFLAMLESVAPKVSQYCHLISVILPQMHKTFITQSLHSIQSFSPGSLISSSPCGILCIFPSTLIIPSQTQFKHL
jgi:hypothetical protein